MANVIIPKQVLYVYPDTEQQVKCFGREESGIPAFPLDIDLKTKNTYKVARNWAENFRLENGSNNKRTVSEKLIENNVFTKLKVLGFESRYDKVVIKAKTEDGFLFDFGFGDFMFSALNSIINKGELDYKFLWARARTRTFIIPEMIYSEMTIKDIIE
jgi:hypothetical protein